MRAASILVVEDDPDIMRILLHALKAGGYEVIPAYGGEDGIRKAKQQKFDLVLTDLSMPKVSGIELIQELKDNPETREIPVIAVTAHVWETLAQSARQVGVDGYISKPFSTKQLLAEVQKHLKPPSA
jgi:CheY-like chemotaxis protein